jgi:hypothetical protein
MATKPVKVLTDLLTKKEIIKQDLSGNILFNVSGVLGNGHVSSSFPITSSYFVGDGRYLTNISGSGGISSVYTSGNISGSGLLANPVFLKDPLVIGTITSSYIYAPQITGNLQGTASYATNAGNINTTNIQNVYKRLRYSETGAFDVTGSAIITLPSSSYGGSSFPTSSYNFVNINVFIKDEDRWVNDLISVQIYTSSTNIYVELSAPALTNTNQYKVIAVNENPDDYVL